MLKANHASQWASWLVDPQILVNHALAAKFVGVVPQVGHDAVMFLAEARNTLVDAIHDSQWFISAFMVLAFWLVCRIPAINIHDRATDRETGNE